VGYNYRNTNDKGVTCATKGTIFTFTDLSGEKNNKASVFTSQGTISIVEEVPVLINGQPVRQNNHGGETTKSVSTTQSAGANVFNSGGRSVNYNNINEAINYLINEINNGESDAEDKADDLMCLGDLYMDADQPGKAVQPYSLAANYYTNEYGEDDLDAIEANLSLAEAYSEAGNKAQAASIISSCIRILEETLEDDEEDYQYAVEEDDEEGQELICEDIADIYDMLGWAYEISGDEEKSEEYYNKAEKGCE
jgi:tetratricopeptide (TPR) repeat protein